MLWRNVESPAARARVNYYVKNGALYPLRRGLYAKDKNYNKLELATKILIPAYVSFETVLASEGIIFQYYGDIFVASYQTKNIVCDGQIYSFKKIKKSVLTNREGIDLKSSCSIATKERAVLDTIYLNKNYHFDNLSPLDWDKLFELLPIYENRRMVKSLNVLFKNFKAN